MSNAPANPPAETLAEKKARLRASASARAAARAVKKEADEVERLELVEKYETELGPEGIAFAIYDATDIGEGFFVVKLAEPVLFQRYLESKTSAADRFDFVFGHVVHPSKDEYKAARGKRPGIDIELANRLGALYGVRIKIDEGK